MYNLYYIESEQLSYFLQQLRKDHRVFSPILKDKEAKVADYSYRNLDLKEPLSFNPYRCIEPLKSFFIYPSEKIAEYFNSSKEVSEITQKTVIFGIKSCDIAAHKIQDFVFLEGVEVDALYRIRRENTFLISSDCTDFKEVCFCLAMDVLPYPNAGFDLNLSPLNDGYIIEVGSAKGEGLIQKYKEFFVLAKDTQISGRQAKRESLINRLKRHILAQDIPAKDKLQQIVKAGFSADTWQKFMLNCVECGGCNLICDTCHCFLLADKKERTKNAKLRVWDSCLYANYARVAGGANPLKTRTQRLRNRFMKKFDFFVDNLGIPGCCGCGRCIEVCLGKIDIREVLKDLAAKAKL